MAPLHSYMKKKPSDKNGFYEDILGIATAHGANARDVVETFARNVLRLMKHSTKPLEGSAALIEQSIHLASLILTSERLRSEKALDEAYTKLHALKHLAPGQNPLQALKNFFMQLVFAPTGGSMAIHLMDPAVLSHQFQNMAVAYDQKTDSYKAKISRATYMAKRLNHLLHIHGFNPQAQGYIIQSNGNLAPVAFGATLASGPGTVFPHVPAGYDHVFVPGVANACLFHAVAVAADPAHAQVLTAQSGRQARRASAAKIKRQLLLDQLHDVLLTQKTMVDVDALIGHLIHAFPDLAQELAAAIDIENDEDRDFAINNLMSNDALFPNQFDITAILNPHLQQAAQTEGWAIENETAQLLLNDLEQTLEDATQENVDVIIGYLIDALPADNDLVQELATVMGIANDDDRQEAIEHLMNDHHMFLSSPHILALLNAYTQHIEDRDEMENDTMVHVLAHAYGVHIYMHSSAVVGVDDTFGPQETGGILHLYHTTYTGEATNIQSSLNHYNALIQPQPPAAHVQQQQAPQAPANSAPAVVLSTPKLGATASLLFSKK